MEIVVIGTLLVVCGAPLLRVARAGAGVIRASAELGADALENELASLRAELAEKRAKIQK